MRPAALPRWTVSFADLALLLLAFFILLHAGGARGVAAGARAAFSSEAATGPLLDASASALFEAGEARLQPSARERLLVIGRAAAAAKHGLRVESEGRDASARRFDGWELSAARAAAIARAFEEAGVPERSVSLVLPAERVGGKATGQRLIVSRGF